ncbi:MAG: hypothetical protein HXX17_12115 [Geobacteraceae bacterium]|nr:hypothetical protein [Geobacteraceae bacterium]
MSIFILKLAIAVIPLLLLVVSVTLLSSHSHNTNHYSLTRYRRRCAMLRAVAHGAMLR